VWTQRADRADWGTEITEALRVAFVTGTHPAPIDEAGPPAAPSGNLLSCLPQRRLHPVGSGTSYALECQAMKVCSNQRRELDDSNDSSNTLPPPRRRINLACSSRLPV